MYAIRQGSKRLVLLLHEIYGINDHMKSYAVRFADLGYDAAIPDLLGGAGPFPYEQEKRAYQYFIEEIGFESAAKNIEGTILQLRKEYEEIHLVGFSVGATVAWLCSGSSDVESMTGYYGSRIRDFLDIDPRCPTLLIYGESEKSFDVKKMAARLDRDKLKSVLLPARHGFADAQSPHYEPLNCCKAWKAVEEFMKS